jgi:hypothetical protein
VDPLDPYYQLIPQQFIETFNQFDYQMLSSVNSYNGLTHSSVFLVPAVPPDLGTVSAFIVPNNSSIYTSSPTYGKSITQLMYQTFGIDSYNGSSVQWQSHFTTRSTQALPNYSLTQLLYTALGSDALGTYIPYLLPVPLPLLKNHKPEQFLTDDNRSVGQASYSVVNSTTVGYYGQADLLSYGLYQLDTAGLPKISTPYLEAIYQQLDLPVSQSTGDIVTSVTTNATRVVNAINASAQTGLATESTQLQNKSLLQGISNTMPTHSDQTTTNDLLTQIKNLLSGLATEATLLSVNSKLTTITNQLQAISSNTQNTVQVLSDIEVNTMNALTPLANIDSAVRYSPPKTVTHTTTGAKTRQNYPSIPLGEMLYRIGFSPQPKTLSTDVSGNNILAYTSVPLVSLFCPVADTQSATNFDAPYVNPGYPVLQSFTSVSQTFNAYASGYDPYSDPDSLSGKMPSGMLNNAALYR